MVDVNLTHINAMRKDAGRPSLEPKDIHAILYGIELMPSIKIDQYHKAFVKRYFDDETNVFERKSNTQDTLYTVATSQRPVAKITSTDTDDTLTIFYEDDYQRILLKELDTLDKDTQPVMYATIKQHINLLDTVIHIRQLITDLDDLRNKYTT